MMAVREHRLDTARLLIGRGADINHRNQDGATALSWAKRGNETDLEKELRRAGAKDYGLRWCLRSAASPGSSCRRIATGVGR